MTFVKPRRRGSTLNYPRGIKLLLLGKMYRSRFTPGWWCGEGLDWRTGDEFGVSSRCWYPPGDTLLICRIPLDLNRWLVDELDTSANFPEGWLATHEPKEEITLQLGLL